MESLGRILQLKPLIFGFGFLAPLIAQIAALGAWDLPFGQTPLALGLAVGGVWGALATWKGRWF